MCPPKQNPKKVFFQTEFSKSVLPNMKTYVLLKIYFDQELAPLPPNTQKVKILAL